MKVLLVIYDNKAHASEFPLGMGYIAAALQDCGHTVEIYSKDVYHYPNSHLTEYLDAHHFDAVGVSTVAGYWQYKELLNISESINNSKNKPFYIIGGHGPASEPEFYLRKTGADCVVVGEGEETIKELMYYLKEGPITPQWKNILGISFLLDNKLVQTPRRPLIEDLDSISFPAWDLFEINHYCLSPFPNMETTDRTFPVLASRGCRFKCNFCYRLDEGYRIRSTENVIEEISQLQKKYNITYISFYDELFMGSPKRTKNMCNAILDSGLKFRWNCDGRLNFAKPDVLKLMKEAGCVFINYGIEAYDNTVLKNMNKNLTTDVIDAGIEATLAEGISPGLNFIFGNKGDTKEVLWKDVAFILRYNDYSQFRTMRPVTAYPGCELYYDALKEGKIKDMDDFYTNKHLNSDLISTNFSELTDEEVYAELLKANKVLILDNLSHNWEKNLKLLDDLYIHRKTDFRGFRHT